jgi:hypothetical protein
VGDIILPRRGKRREQVCQEKFGWEAWTRTRIIRSRI